MVKVIKMTLFSLLIIGCIFSLISYMYFTDALDIERVMLKRDILKIVRETYDFNVNKLNNKTYNVVLKFLVRNELESSALRKKMFMVGEYNVNVQLMDGKGDIIKSENLSDGSKMAGGWSQRCVEWILLRFEAKKRQNYMLKITFQSNDNFFDGPIKEIYLEEDYDYAALPWWRLFQYASLIIFVITLVPILIIWFLWLRNKKRG